MMPVQSAGNSLYFGDPFMSLKDYAIGIAGGALTGGIANGSIAALKGNNFWTGKDVQFGKGTFSFNNTPTRPAPEMKLLEAPTPSLNVEQPAIGAANDRLSDVASTKANEFHYTTKEGYNEIMKSQELLPSLGAKHARFGNGQYFTDLQPSNYTAGQISRRLYEVPWNGRKLSYFIKIDVSGLNVVNNAPHNYLIPGNAPLNIQNRIVGGGATIFKIKF